MNKKQLIITIIIVIILAAIGGGWFWYVNNRGEQVNPPVTENSGQGPQDSSNTENNQLQGEVVGSPAADVDMSDWLTYRNEEYGFEFNYPADLLKSKNEYYITVLSNTSANININILNEKLNPDTITSLIGIVTKESLEAVIVGGKNSYRFRDGDMGYGGNSYRIPLDYSHTLILWFVTAGGYYDNEDEIISAFKFI